MSDRDCYAAVADELNDGTPDQMTLEDLDPYYVVRAKRYAEANGLSWPPQTGDFDRLWERENNR